jgi:hypothetical protein
MSNGTVLRFVTIASGAVPSGSGNTFIDATNDTAAAALGVQEGGLYRNGSVVMVRSGADNSFADAIDDTAAAALGVPVGGTYRNGSVVMVRIT